MTPRLDEGFTMRILFYSIIAISAALIGGSLTAQAADSACKGLTTQACSTNTSCSWVKPYKRKGKDVAGFCRKKASHKLAKPKTAG